jgi:hypothetical protein
MKRWDKLKDYLPIHRSIQLVGCCFEDPAGRRRTGAGPDHHRNQAGRCAYISSCRYARMLDELGHAPEANLAIGRAAARPDVKPWADILSLICDKTMAADSGLTSKIARAELALWKQDAASALNALAAPAT